MIRGVAAGPFGMNQVRLHITQAQQRADEARGKEAVGERKEARAFYRQAIDHLMQALDLTSGTPQRELLKEKIKELLAKAESC